MILLKLVVSVLLPALKMVAENPAARAKIEALIEEMINQVLSQGHALGSVHHAFTSPGPGMAPPLPHTEWTPQNTAAWARGEDVAA